MDIGLGLPTSVPGTQGRDILDWAIEGERAGFSTLATLDRLVFDSYECLTALAAVAAVTERARLATAIMIAPLRTNTALIAKQAASVDRLSGGRLVLGMAVGSRPDDFTASGAEYAGRGRRFGEQIAEMRRIWSGERRGFAGAVGPSPLSGSGPERNSGPQIIIGGQSPAAIARAAELGEGWISGGGGPGMFRGGAQAVRGAWAAAGRPGKPRLMALVYFALGDDAASVAGSYLRGYYGFAPPYAEAVVKNAAVGEDAVTDSLAQFSEAGCDEVVLVPCSAAIGQIELLASALAAAGMPVRPQSRAEGQ